MVKCEQFKVQSTMQKQALSVVKIGQKGGFSRHTRG